MSRISYVKNITWRSLWRRLLFQCFTVGLLLGLTAGTPCAAFAAQASLHPSVATATRTGTRRGVAELESDKMSKTEAICKPSLPDHLRQVSYIPSVSQNPFEGLGSISEGQALMAQQTRQSLTDAIAKFKEGFALCQKNGNQAGMGAARFNEGIAYDALGKPREALSAFLDAARYLDEAGLSFMNPMVFAATGATYASLGETDKALDYLNRALPALKRANLPQFLAYALKGLGEVNVQIGQKRKALEYLNGALALYRQIDDWRHEVQVLALINTLRALLGQSTEALEMARAAIARAQEKGALDFEALGHFTAGAAYTAVGNLEQAASEYNQALPIFQTQHDGFGEASTLNNLGLIYVAKGEFDRALDVFKSALQLYKDSHEAGLAAYVTNNIGTIYSRRGDPVKALRHFQEARDFAVQHKDKRLEAAVLSSLADTYFSINNHEYALKSLKEAAAAFAAIEEPGHESEALISLADGYAVLGRYQEALNVLRSVLESRRVAEDPGRQGYVLREMGYIYHGLGDRGQALMRYAEALAKFEAARDDIGKVDLYLAWGATLVANQDYQKAEELLIKGLTLAQSAGLRQSESLGLALRGLLHERQGDLAQAESLYDQGIAISETLRSSARIEEIKMEVGSISATLLVPATLLKFRLGKQVEAFELAEKARARTFLDQLNSVHIDIRKGAAFQHIGILSLEFHVDKLSRPLL